MSFRNSLVAACAAGALLAGSPALCQDAPKPGPGEAATVEKVYDLGTFVPKEPDLLAHAYHSDLVGLGIWDPNEYSPIPLNSRTPPNTNRGSGEVLELLMALRAPDAVSEFALGGDGRRVVVRTTEEGHRQVRAALEWLRRRTAWSVRVDARALAIPASAVDEEVRGLLVRGAGGGLDAAGVRRLASLDVHAGRRAGTVVAGPGAWSILRLVRSIDVLATYDVEIAQESSIADPIVVPYSDGFMAALRAFPRLDGAVQLRLAASAGDLQLPFRRLDLRTTDLGEIEQPEYAGCAAITEMTLRQGQSAVVVVGSEAGAPEPVWNAMVLTLGAAPAALTETAGLAYLPLGALASTERPWRVAWPYAEDWNLRDLTAVAHEGELPPQAMSPDELLEVAREAAGAALHQEGAFVSQFGATGAPALVVRGGDGVVRAMRDALDRLERDSLRPARVSLTLTVEDGAGGRRNLGLIAAPVVPGRPASMAAYRAVSYVRDYDVEVAEKSRIADPIVAVAYGGFFANLRVSAAPGGGWTVDLGVRVASAPTPQVVREVNPSAAEIGVLQSVTVETRSTSMLLDLANGRAETLDLGSDPFTPGGRGRLVLSVQVDGE